MLLLPVRYRIRIIPKKITIKLSSPNNTLLKMPITPPNYVSILVQW